MFAYMLKYVFYRLYHIKGLSVCDVKGDSQKTTIESKEPFVSSVHIFESASIEEQSEGKFFPC